MSQNQVTEMKTDKQSAQVLASRRKLIKTLSAAGGAVAVAAAIPEKWTRPVVQSIFLPVHARTSSTNLRIGGRLGNGVVDTGSDPKKGILDYFIDTAVAQDDFLGGGCAFTDIPLGSVGQIVIFPPNGPAIRGDAFSNGINMIADGPGFTLQGFHIEKAVVSGEIKSGDLDFPFIFDQSGFIICAGNGPGFSVTPTPGAPSTATPHYTATP